MENRAGTELINRFFQSSQTLKVFPGTVLSMRTQSSVHWRQNRHMVLLVKYIRMYNSVVSCGMVDSMELIVQQPVDPANPTGRFQLGFRWIWINADWRWKDVYNSYMLVRIYDADFTDNVRALRLDAVEF